MAGLASVSTPFAQPDAVCDRGTIGRQSNTGQIAGGRVSFASEMSSMLHCNMNTQLSLQLSLDDLLAEFKHARRQSDLGRLALLAYCDIRRWARRAGERSLADHAAAMFTDQPHASREAFLEQVDSLLFELQQAQSRYLEAMPNSNAAGFEPRLGRVAAHA